MEAFITLAIGVWQIVVVVLLVLLLFGGRKIPELMRGVGQGMQEFKKATADNDDDEIIVDDTEDTKKVKDGKK
ncbi:MAG: twin-arginine translocase TatA/TatE family subunit [Bacteroidetes bacterium]|jgi:sec-independent protein translocase protein TatA|nr:MAG: twin-arginine translocase TatA/TatE family subunit [Bacteroidota bacterium]RLD72551.1 MAG: twin-arginine translocase TatA/TatE family subunit [Bacteroidota bacterium]RLD94944.1 MAG: twin-arginine translocase TatA/TatE family subunit [Bacteroidota bacterium]RLE03523.1 MAG: twin-arginine translocase TatA/TatE family subunit [Bacteroidota bacterium]